MRGLLRGSGVFLTGVLLVVSIVVSAAAQPTESQYPREPGEEQYFDVSR